MISMTARGCSPRRLTRLLARALTGLAALALTSASWAWGAQGHRMVGYVADAELSPKARIAVRRIMQADSLASVANWMDEVRDTPEGRSMQRWHFVTNKVCGTGEPSCKNGNCVTGKIEWAREVLKSGSPDEALKALRVLVHLVGDIHQPLHTAENGDYGGNGITVENRQCLEFGKTEPSACKLHTYWDTELVKAAVRGQSEQVAAAAWSTVLGKLPATDPDAAAAWAAESFDLAKRTAYRFDSFACKVRRGSFMATDDYDSIGLATVQPQIAKAGKRLARTLNAIFQ